MNTQVQSPVLTPTLQQNPRRCYKVTTERRLRRAPMLHIPGEPQQTVTVSNHGCIYYDYIVKRLRKHPSLKCSETSPDLDQIREAYEIFMNEVCHPNSHFIIRVLKVENE